MEILQEISSFLQKGRSKSVKELVTKALEEGVSAQTILDEALLSGMSIIGEKFKKNEVFVPEVLVSARAMNAGVEILRPYLITDGVSAKGTAILGTVKGDLHDIGKNIVKIMLEGKGITVIDIGVDVDAQNFIDKAIEHNANIICCSALLSTTMPEMATVVQCAKDAGIYGKIKIMIGGAVVTQEFCDKIGADYFTPDATTASEVALKICLGENC